VEFLIISEVWLFQGYSANACRLLAFFEKYAENEKISIALIDF
jgi:hypothetical protein